MRARGDIMNSEYAKPFYFPGGRHGCLLLHGFTGSPGHMRYLGENLSKHGYTVFAPLLPGHGATLEAMRSSNWLMWLGEARRGYQRLKAECGAVTVIGLSMGGTLALILAEEYPVDSLVCLSAAIRLRARHTWAAPALALMRPYQRWEGEGPRPDRTDFLHDYDWGYDGMPVAKVGDLRKLIRIAARNLFAVVAPALIIQPELDETVDPRSARIIHDCIGSERKELVTLSRSSHVCTLDLERDTVLSLILKHLRHIDDTNPLAQITNDPV